MSNYYIVSVEHQHGAMSLTFQHKEYLGQDAFRDMVAKVLAKAYINMNQYDSKFWDLIADKNEEFIALMDAEGFSFIEVDLPHCLYVWADNGPNAKDPDIWDNNEPDIEMTNRIKKHLASMEK